MKERQMMHNLDRVPPQDIEAEQAILGAVILEGEALEIVREILLAEDFYRDSNRKIFAAMLELSAEKKAIDIVTIVDLLRDKGELEAVGGVQYLSSLADRVATSANVKHHADIVKKKALLRGVLNAVSEMAKDVYEGADDLPLIVNNGLNSLSKIESRIGVGGIDKLGIGADELLEFGSYFRETPFRSLNESIGGFRAKGLIVVGGRAGMGKTAFQLSCLRKVVFEDGLPSVYFGSGNHPTELFLLKLIAGMCSIDYHDLLRSRLSIEQLTAIKEARQRIAEAPIHVECANQMDVLSMISKIRRTEDKVGRLGMICIENLQDLLWPKKTNSPKEKMDRVTEALRTFINKDKTPMQVSSQINRSSVDGEDSRPQLSDLKESGIVEDLADVVLLLHREAYHKKTADGSPESGEIIIAKGGPPKTVLAKFEGQFCRWRDEE